jgi:hypothetical protein
MKFVNRITLCQKPHNHPQTIPEKYSNRNDGKRVAS